MRRVTTHLRLGAETGLQAILGRMLPTARDRTLGPGARDNTFATTQRRVVRSLVSGGPWPAAHVLGQLCQARPTRFPTQPRAGEPCQWQRGPNPKGRLWKDTYRWLQFRIPMDP